MDLLATNVGRELPDGVSTDDLPCSSFSNGVSDLPPVDLCIGGLSTISFSSSSSSSLSSTGYLGLPVAEPTRELVNRTSPLTGSTGSGPREGRLSGEGRRFGRFSGSIAEDSEGGV